MRRAFAALSGALLLFCAASYAQTTQALISGRLVHVQSGDAIAGGTVTCWNASTGAQASAISGSDGNYYMPLLSPGLYRVRADAKDYQPREVQELDLPVAGRLELNFTLRPLSDVWEAGQYRSVFLPGSKTIVTFYGPDVDTSRSSSFEATKGTRGALESTLSSVIDPRQVRDLPLAGRDVYTMLVTQPGVTAESGTARGLGLSVTGARPSSSNYLLDGLENNNYLVTGPQSVIAPEAIQEYRVTTNNFSAEYGRTAGFLANAVTRSGGNQFHGIGYFYLKNDALNANTFQQNRLGQERLPVKERQLGFHVGGPVLQNRLFFSSAYENLRSRSRLGTEEIALPTPYFVSQFGQVAGRKSIELLRQYPSVATNQGFALSQLVEFNRPVSVDRGLSIQRIDWNSRNGADRVMGRVALNSIDRPDFNWSPYKDFVAGLTQDTASVAVTWTHSLRPGLTTEARVGWARDDLQWDRGAHPEIPTLITYDFSGNQVLLPGSLSLYEYRNDSRSREAVGNVIWARGKHLVTTGGGVLLRSSSGFQTVGRDGYYGFDTLLDFAFDEPSVFLTALSRTAYPDIRQPAYDREYGYRQFNVFVQDTFKATRRLVLNAGLRYENFGAPKNTGSVKDSILRPGPGATWTDRLVSATFDASASGDQELYKADSNNFAGRAGFSYDLTGTGSTLFRAAYGIFFDRPFDNLWQNVRYNSFVLPAISIRRPFNFLMPAEAALRAVADPREPFLDSTTFPNSVLFDGNLRDAYAQTYFYGIQRQVSDNFTVEVNGTGSLGRKLLVTDTLNRVFDARGGLISYRASQGLSNYQGLSAVARYRGSRFNMQASYTLSHSIDHQSDALTGDFFDLSVSQLNDAGSTPRPGLALESNLRADRGSSDFDQRHNFVIYSIWDAPAVAQGTPFRFLLRDWKFSQLSAFRSGFPYSVFGQSSITPDRKSATFENRASVSSPNASTDRAADGGRYLLNRSAFFQQDPSVLGNTGRNAFRGPGLFNIDLSVGRSFGLRWLGESGKITFRADAFNVLNHTNLSSPQNQLGDSNFGFAPYGRLGQASGFPAVSPFNETARQVQMILRIEF